MAEWTELELGEVLTFQRGFDLPRQVRNPGPYPVVSSSGVTGWHDEFKVKPPGVVIGRTGSLGSVYWIDEPFWPLNTSLWVKDFKGNDPRFLSYLLQTVAMNDSTTAAVPGVNRNHLHKIHVGVPDKRTQRRIGALLSSLDELADISEQRINLLDGITRSIYRHWQTGAEVDASAGGWSTAALEEVAEARRGLSWKRDAEHNGGIRVLTIPNVKRRLRLEGGVRIDRVSEAEREKFSLRRDDVLMIGSNGNPMRVGQAVLVPEDVDALFASFLIRIRADRKIISPYLLFLQLTEGGTLAPLRAGAVGSTGLRNIRISALRSVTVTIPPLLQQAEFDALTKPLLGMMRSLETRRQWFGNIRNLLLHRLVTGRIDITEIDLGIVGPTETE
jgi:type I restriction enzyme S subunit